MSIHNQSGNIIDFLYSTPNAGNSFLIEIKTPATRLLGSQYRGNAYSISQELSGSVVQILNYKDELLKNYHSLKHQTPDLNFSVFNPTCLVIAGSFIAETMDGNQRRSFELFRSSISGVQIMTYDELFGKIRDLVELVTE